jgi:hypothetical protein
LFGPGVRVASFIDTPREAVPTSVPGFEMTQQSPPLGDRLLTERIIGALLVVTTSPHEVVAATTTARPAKPITLRIRINFLLMIA